MDAFTQDFMTQYEKSKREAMKRTRPVGGLLMEGIFEEMNLSQGFDTTNQEQTQQQHEQEEQQDLTQLELQALPFIIETDWAAEFGDEIAATEADDSSEHNSESTLQNQSCLSDQPTAPTVNEVEFTDSVTVTDNSPSKPSSESELILKPKENNDVLSQPQPFIMETDAATEDSAQILETAEAMSSQQISESAPALQNQSCLLDQSTAAVVNEVEFTDSVTVVDNSPSKPSEHEIILKPKENNAVPSLLAPFIMETDCASEFCDEIAATEADDNSKQNAESTLQNQSTAPVVNEVEFTDSVSVTDKSPSKPSSESELILKPKENNDVLSPLAPFIMETDESTEVFAQISETAEAMSSQQISESAPALQNESCLIDQPIAPVNEVTHSMNVVDNSPSKPSSEPEIILKPKENNALLSPLPPFTLVPLTNNPNNVRLQSTTLSDQQQPTAVITSTSTPTSSQMVKPKMTRIDIRNNTGTITIGNNNNNIRVINNDVINNNDSNQTKSNMIIASKNNYRRSLRSYQKEKTYNFRFKKNSSSINTAVNTNNNVNKSVINKNKVVQDRVNKTNKKANKKINNEPNKKTTNKKANKKINNEPNKKTTNKKLNNKRNNKPNSKTNKSRIIKSKNNTKSNVINKSGGTINRNNINNPSNNSIICIANISEEASNKVGVSKDSFGEASKANNVEMVDTQQDQAAVETRPYLCATCNFRFTSYRDLQIHAAVHNNKFVLKCRFCEREFGCDTSRMNHEQIEHEKIQHYRCTWEGCRFASTARCRVVSHVGSIHFGVPPQEQRQMESAEADFGFYVRKVNPIKSEK